jgi:hypothetical protein
MSFTSGNADSSLLVRLLEFRPMSTLSARARARKIKLLPFDVDGVLTDGKLFFYARRLAARSAPAIRRKGLKARSK